MICQLCRKRVFRLRNGEWYHRHNGSAFCRPGYGHGQKVVPLEIEVPGESRNVGSRVIEQAGKRAGELFAMAEDENWLGI